MGKNLFVGNLSYSMTERTLQELFERIGEVVSARIIKDKISGKSRGFAFVEMGTDELAAKAIAELDGTEVDGRQVKISEAKAKAEGEDRPRRSYGDRPSGPRGGGGGGRFGGREGGGGRDGGRRDGGGGRRGGSGGGGRGSSDLGRSRY